MLNYRWVKVPEASQYSQDLQVQFSYWINWLHSPNILVNYQGIFGSRSDNAKIKYVYVTSTKSGYSNRTFSKSSTVTIVGLISEK